MSGFQTSVLFKDKMKIKIVTTVDEYELQSQTMFIDDKKQLVVRDLYENPEDATIGRDLVDCHEIYAYMKKAHQAGLRGEELVLEMEGNDNE